MMTKLTHVAATGAALLFLPWLSSAQNPLLPDSVAASGILRNNYTGFVGMQFTLNSAIQVTSLGRAYFPGNSGTHTLKVVTAASGVDLSGSVVKITMTAGAQAFQYAPLPQPIILNSGVAYLLLSSETAGGDTWHDLESITPSGGYAAFNIGGAVYSNAAGSYIVAPNTTGFSYVPPNLLYGAPVNTPATVAITSPSNGQTIAASSTPFDISATVTTAASFLSGSLQFQLDGQNFLAPVPGPSYSPVTITMLPSGFLSGSHTLAAIYTAPGAAPVTSPPITFSVQGELTTFIKSKTPGPLRNNFTGFVGMEFGVDKNGVTTHRTEVAAIGRYIWPGNTQSHLLKLYDATSGQDVFGGSATLSTSGIAPGQFAYAYLTSPIVLLGTDTYYLLSQETAGGDQWADYGSVTTDQFPGNGPVYQAGASYVPVNLGAAYSYVPLDLLIHDSNIAIQYPAPNATLSGVVNVLVSVEPLLTTATIQYYQLNVNGNAVGSSYTAGSIPLDTTLFANGTYTLTVTAQDSYINSYTSIGVPITITNSVGPTNPVPFVTGVHTTFLRNNYTGFLGMQFTVGATPLQVESLGRYCAAGNSGAHAIKLVRTSTGSDVPGSDTSVNMTGCTVGKYVYATLPVSIALTAGTSVELVDQETAGGDQWYDYSPITTTTDAAVNGSVYANSAGNYVLVPPSSTSYVPLNFIYSLGGGSQPLTTSITSFTDASLSATATGSSPITSVQFQIDGFPISPTLTSYPYTLLLPYTLNYGVHLATSVAHDAAGDVATSASSFLLLPLPAEGSFTSLVNSAPGVPRNNYTGWVGFQFTQGGSVPINTGGSLPANTPAAIGRVCAAGNAQPHIVKIVRASDGVDVLSTWINCGDATSYSSYGPARFTAPLVPGQSYYLVSQETSGGDTFADVAPATPFYGILGGGTSTSFASNFTIDGPVYFDGSKYVLVPQLPNYSYAGVYLLGFTSPI